MSEFSQEGQSDSQISKHVQSSDGAQFETAEADAEHTKSSSGEDKTMSKQVVESTSPELKSSTAKPGEIPSQNAENADDVLTVKMAGGTRQSESTAAADASLLAASRVRTRRSFLVGGVAAAGAYGFYHWLDYGPHRDYVPALLDRNYDTNAAISRTVLHDRGLAPTYPVSRAETLRVNGIFGLKKELELDTWRLQLVGTRNDSKHPRYVSDVTAWNYKYKGTSHDDAGHDTKTNPNQQSSIKMAPAPMLVKAEQDENATGSQKTATPYKEDDNHTGRKPRGLEEAGESDSTLPSGTPGLLLTFDDFLPQLKRYEMVTQFKCIEGWSQIVHWAGVRFSDFLDLFPPALVNGREPRYVYMETPNGDYYVGYDLHACRHPQTLLVTEMMGAPLTQSHGAPLRLHAPTKYGYKQIKRIGLIAYTDDKPDDYWTKLGYDWYAGL